MIPRLRLSLHTSLLCYIFSYLKLTPSVGSIDFAVLITSHNVFLSLSLYTTELRFPGVTQIIRSFKAEKSRRIVDPPGTYIHCTPFVAGAPSQSSKIDPLLRYQILLLIQTLHTSRSRNPFYTLSQQRTVSI